MKKRTRIILVVLLALAGIGLISYPYISNWINVRTQTTAINEYKLTVAELRNEEIEEELRLAYEYNELIDPIRLVNDPFTGVREEGEDERYYAQLDLTSIMAYLEIPKINVKLPVYHGTSEAVLSKALGHLQGSSLPVGGDSTHSIITGHRGLPSAMLLTDLDKMVIGDMFYVMVYDRVLAYQVDEIKIIDPNDTESLRVFQSEDYVTLMTCTPYGINSHRLLVRGTHIELPPEDEEALINEPDIVSVSPVIIAAIAVVAGVVIFWLRRRGTRKKSGA